MVKDYSSLIQDKKGDFYHTLPESERKCRSCGKHVPDLTGWEGHWTGAYYGNKMYYTEYICPACSEKLEKKCLAIAEAIEKAHEAVGGREMSPQEIADGAAAFAEDEETAQAAKKMVFKYARDEEIVRQLPEPSPKELERQRLFDAKKLREYQLRGWHGEPERHAKAARKGRLRKYG